MRLPILHEFPSEDILVFAKIKNDLERLLATNLGESAFDQDIFASPQILAGVFSEIYDLEYVCGIFANYENHCWILTKNTNIIDAMPPGIYKNPPILIHGRSTLAHLYKPKPSYHFNSRLDVCKSRIKGILLHSNRQ